MRIGWTDVQIAAASVCAGACGTLSWNLLFTHPTRTAWLIQSAVLVGLATVGTILGSRSTKDKDS